MGISFMSPIANGRREHGAESFSTSGLEREEVGQQTVRYAEQEEVRHERRGRGLPGLVAPAA